ncbi:MAG: hypothetical protein JSW61_05860 [Candidatus Thorarchaeota archaeon]|nr:MAG: hypothetical protein JSW61_05860 [Candidatus Thorarchaeota archaeon]
MTEMNRSWRSAPVFTAAGVLLIVQAVVSNVLILMFLPGSFSIMFLLGSVLALLALTMYVGAQLARTSRIASLWGLFWGILIIVVTIGIHGGPYGTLFGPYISPSIEAMAILPGIAGGVLGVLAAVVSWAENTRPSTMKAEPVTHLTG